MATLLIEREPCSCGILARSFDVDRANFIINHPTVRPEVGGDPTIELDLGPIVSKTENYLLLSEFGGFLCTWTAPFTYEVHTFILPEGRGRHAYKIARDGIAYMADQGASHLWTRVRKGAVNVRRFTLSAGFKLCGSQELDLGIGPVSYDLFHWRKECR